MIESLGYYLNRQTGVRYEILKRTKISTHTPLSGNRNQAAGSIDFITHDGIDVQPLDDSLQSFELIQIDGILDKEHA